MKKICPKCGMEWECYHDESNANHFCKLSYSEANTSRKCDGCGDEHFGLLNIKNGQMFCDKCFYTYKKSFNNAI